MEIYTQRFVLSSDLFKDLDDLYAVFNDDDLNEITWGGVGRSMLSPSYLLRWINFEHIQEVIAEEALGVQVETLKSRLWSLEPDQVMVDLEN
jgi:hypothetical protein